MENNGLHLVLVCKTSSGILVTGKNLLCLSLQEPSCNALFRCKEAIMLYMFLQSSCFRKCLPCLNTAPQQQNILLFKCLSLCVDAFNGSHKSISGTLSNIFTEKSRKHCGIIPLHTASFMADDGKTLTDAEIWTLQQPLRGGNIYLRTYT